MLYNERTLYLNLQFIKIITAAVLQKTEA